MIHNACQTIRRPTCFYKHLWVMEQKADLGEVPLSREAKAVLARSDEKWHQYLAGVATGPLSPRALQNPQGFSATRAEQAVTAAMTCRREAEEQVVATSAAKPIRWATAALSALEVTDEDKQDWTVNAFDVNQQAIDLRTRNSWTLKLEDVETPELVEVLTINSMAPFILNGRLKSLLQLSRFQDRFIVNVSAMEGKFYRAKQPTHPHTNMAKAALNMMTRTSAQAFAIDGIFMNAVDTGWINDENPLPTAQRIAQSSGFQTPIDELDAASRVLDPIFVGIKDGLRPFGRFFKDYRETEW